MGRSVVTRPSRNSRTAAAHTSNASAGAAFAELGAYVAELEGRNDQGRLL